jgi:hypothetical protein
MIWIVYNSVIRSGYRKLILLFLRCQRLSLNQIQSGSTCGLISEVNTCKIDMELPENIDCIY